MYSANGTKKWKWFLRIQKIRTSFMGHLQNDDNNDAIVVPQIVRKSLKRKRGQEIYDEIIVERLS